MKCLALTNLGIEEECMCELRSLTSSKVSLTEAGVFFEVKDYEELCKTVYLSKIPNKIILLLKSIEFISLSDILNEVSQLDLKEYFPDGFSFICRCSRNGEHTFTSNDVEKSCGEIIFKKYALTVDFKNPSIIFFVYIIDNFCHIGIDFSGVDLSKRSYYIYHSSQTIKPNIAAAVLTYADYTGKQNLLDTFCNEGTIPIEASLIALNKSAFYYNKDELAFTKLPFLKHIDFEHFFFCLDSMIKDFKPHIYCMSDLMKFVSYSKKNSKIIDVNKHIDFTRVSMEWLDTKFNEGEVDLIVTSPPLYTKIKPKDQVEKLYKEMFYQFEFCLNKKGSIILLTEDTSVPLLNNFAEEYKFKLKNKKIIFQGKKQIVLLHYLVI